MQDRDFPSQDAGFGFFVIFLLKLFVALDLHPLHGQIWRQFPAWGTASWWPWGWRAGCRPRRMGWVYPQNCPEPRAKPSPSGWAFLDPWEAPALSNLQQELRGITFPRQGNTGFVPMEHQEQANPSFNVLALWVLPKLIIRQRCLVNAAKIPSNCTLLLPSHSTFSSGCSHGNIYPLNSLSGSSHIPSWCAGKWTFNLRGRNPFQNNKERAAPLLEAGENIFAAAISFLSLLFFPPH